eukprot:scaffold139056_cov17-Prasinocladus_malaysianus.AAC.1
MAGYSISVMIPFVGHHDPRFKSHCCAAANTKYTTSHRHFNKKSLSCLKKVMVDATIQNSYTLTHQLGRSCTRTCTGIHRPAQVPVPATARILDWSPDKVPVMKEFEDGYEYANSPTA